MTRLLKKLTLLLAAALALLVVFAPAVSTLLAQGAPVAANDSYYTPLDAMLNVSAPGVLANDAYDSLLPLTTTLLSTTSSGTLTFNTNGTFTYIPNAGFSGTDTFTYQIQNDGQASNSATVSINVGVIHVGCTNGVGDTAALINAINRANSTVEPDVIELTAGCTYTLTEIVASVAEGSFGVPFIETDITIDGNGATVTAVPYVSFVFVASGGKLSLTNSFLTNVQHGVMSYMTSPGGGEASTRIYDSTIANCDGYGAAAGGGATLDLENVTITGCSIMGYWKSIVNSTIGGDQNGISMSPDNHGFIRNSIILVNLQPHNDTAIVESQGFNLLLSNEGLVGDTSTNIVATEPRLGPLQNNGGLTPTMALLDGSPAIDAGNCDAGTDQRGLPRPVDAANYPNASGGNGCDIGAVEMQNPGNPLPPGVDYAPGCTNGVGDTAALINAINVANSNDKPDVIELAAGCTYTLTVVDNTTSGANGLPVVSSEITINGNGATISRSDTSETPRFRILYISSTGALRVNDLSITRGYGEQQETVGSGILIEGGLLNLNNSLIANNYADRYGAGIAVVSGTLNLYASSVNDNYSSNGTGGIFSIHGSTVTIVASTVANNVNDIGPASGGIDNHNQSIMRIESSLILNNSGCIGSSIFNNVGTLDILNSTIISEPNVVNSPCDSVIANYQGTLTFLDSTFIGGKADNQDELHSSSVFKIGNSVISSLDGTFESLGHNLIVETSGVVTGNTTGNVFGTDPKLGPLQDNGGPTLSMALLDGSAAIDAGNCAAGTDQRGQPRPVDASNYPNAGNGCDIGAVEMQNPGGSPGTNPSPNPSEPFDPLAPTDLQISGFPTRPTYSWSHYLSPFDTLVPDDWYRVVVIGDTVPVDYWDFFLNICEGTRCSVTLDTELNEGTYSWYVQSFNQTTRTFRRSQTATFMVDTDGIPSPGLITRTAPTRGANFTNGQVKFQWLPDTYALWYRMVVTSTNGFVFDQWYEGSKVCQNGVCTVIRPLPSNTYDWYMVAWGPGGMGSWGGPTSGINFSVGAAKPGVPVPVYPADGETLDIPAGAVQLQWQSDPNAAYYRVFISGANGFVYDEWKDAAEICTETTCTVSVYLSNGAYVWYMVGWSSEGMGGWNSGTAFAINTPKPGIIQQIAPQGEALTPTVAFQWQADLHAGWYRIFALNNGDGYIYDQWVSAADTCAGGVCTFTDGVIPNGSYSWWIGAWSPGGMGEWDLEPMNFSLNIPAPGSVMPTAPAAGSGVLAGSVTLQWHADANALWYHVQLESTAGFSYDEWLKGKDQCFGDVCSVPLSLGAGSYTWTMQAWGPGGMGGTSNPVQFNVNP